jgi:hypothetical protein
MANGRKKPRIVPSRAQLASVVTFTMGSVIVQAQKPVDRPKDSDKLLDTRKATKVTGSAH